MMGSATEGEARTTKSDTFSAFDTTSGVDVADLAVAALIAVLLAVAFATHTRWLIPNHDNEWYLIATARMLAGGHYITDFMEPNPPLIMLLMVPPVVLAQLTQLDPYAAFSLYVCLLIALSVLLAAPSLRWLFATDAIGRRAALICYAAILALSPAYQFGQREHLFVILFCPGLFWFAAREAGRRSPLSSAWLAIVLAAVAVLIKPFYLLVPAILLAFRGLRQRSWRVLIDPAVAVFLVVTALYGAVILLAFPEYLTEAAIENQVYFGWDRSWTTVFDASRDAATVLCLAVLFVELLPTSLAPEWFLRVLYVAAATCLVLGIGQKKGWAYQLLPTVEIAGFALVFRLMMLRSLLREPRFWARSAAVLMALIIQLAFLAAEPWQETTAETRARVRTEPLIATLRQIATGKSVLLLTSGYQPGYPSMTDTKLAGRAPSQTLLPGIVKLADGTPAQRVRAVALRQIAVHELVEDLQRYRPDFVAVDRHRDLLRRQVEQARPDGFDILRFYDSDPAFAEAWRAYRLDRSIPGWDIYARALPDSAVSGAGATQ